MRLDKYVSLARIGTRKKVKEYIYRGEVQVNGETVLVPALEVDEKSDEISYCGKVISGIDRICYMFYKPQGCVTAKNDGNHKTVFSYFPELDTAGLFAVGRLDRDTEGLLLITNDGDLNHRLMKPEHHVEKTYFFWVFGAIDEAGVQAVRQGMDIGQGERAKPGEIEIVAAGTYTELRGEMERDGCQVVKQNLHRQDVTAGYLTISEGKKHQVKRMMRSIGCYVVYLKRVSIGRLKLDEELEKGGYRELTALELAEYRDQN
ncbi:pseudouridine synthase [Hespellia stercorisuis]|uniref:Pseudouridine synthase n=1 Tax=Hespellia stercorisuis DSM 15480 TaxID=1121950 RepID=A0A1M6U7Q4_9FIRM|nr:pseudouridine synthase [Hespellia stercorisuis]SHK65203.1 ribosomal small subunit pseudouridine synthase A [Hespellia stercorisuis DSM 15480]